MLLAGSVTKREKQTGTRQKTVDPKAFSNGHKKAETLVQAKEQVAATPLVSTEFEGLVASPEVCRRIGISRGRLSRLIADMGIIPKVQRGRRGGGIHWFSLEQIQRVIDRRAEIRQANVVKNKNQTERISIHEKEDGAAAQIAFTAFKAGLSPRETVIQHKLSPEVVRHLWSQWQNLDGGCIFTMSDMRTLSAFPWERSGSILDAKALVDVLRNHFAILRDEAKCRGCKKNQAFFCTVCLREKISKVEAAYLGTSKVG
jgi:hypothetical protein